MKNQQVKNDKKLKSTIEFKNWLKKKEKEEVSKKSTYNNNNENATKNNKETFQNRQNNIKINLGAYSTAKALRGIEKKFNNDLKALSSYYEANNNNNNNMTEEKENKKEKISDSLQDLSSIKRETPDGGVEQPYID